MNEQVSFQAWEPQPGPQLDAIQADFIPELFFGGAKFGGKSDFLLGDFLAGVEEHGENWHGILIRQTIDELSGIMQRAHQLYPLTGAIWKEGKRTWYWPNGATLKMRYLERPRDFYKYNGHSYTWIGFDEIGAWASPEGYHLMKGCLRWAQAPVPNKRIRATGNPGGPGHQWTARYFVDPAPHGYTTIYDHKTKMKRMFIPSRITDNKLGLEADPDYVNRLHGMGSAQLVRAMLEGDYSAFVGAFFPEFGNKHILHSFQIPKHWPKFRSFDWGSASPFSVGWHAVSDGTKKALNLNKEWVHIPAGALIRYREWYGADNDGKGLHLTNVDLAKGILDRERIPESYPVEYEKIEYGVADPSIWIRSGGPSIQEDIARAGVHFKKAENDRIQGWKQLRDRLVGEDGKPMYYMFVTCPAAASTLASLPPNPINSEDADTNAEDHAPDEIRYSCMSRPYVRKLPRQEPIRGHNEMSLNELLSQEGL